MMLDETTVATILNRYFPMAPSRAVVDAAKDVVLLELLVDDRVLVWEDALSNRQDSQLVTVTAGSLPRHES